MPLAFLLTHWWKKRRIGGLMSSAIRSDPVEELVLDLLEWLGTSARPYDVVMDAWRTSCPRLPVWETANDRGLVERRRTGNSRPGVAVSVAGQRYLAQHRPHVASSLA
jgi:D-3-phosphoglycerate dehydrogenase